MINQSSHRVQMVKPSPTIAVITRAAELRAAGYDIVSLGAGEPDFDTPDHIKVAAIKAIHEGKTKYTAVDGTIELKNAIINKFKRDNGHEYALNQILVSTGGKQSFFNLCLALLNKGDEVIITAPYWVSYPDMVVLAEGVPVIIKTDLKNRFKLTPEQLAIAITPTTKLIVLNSPSNPSGTAYTRTELMALAEVLLRHTHVMIATDDMYEYILWSNESFCNILMACPDLYDRTIVLNGVSKAYAMTGWRIGYAGGPAWLIKNMKKIQSQSTSNPCSIAQAAATEALAGLQFCVREMLFSFKKRHDYVVNRLNTLPGITAIEGDGTFYTFPDCREAIKKFGFVKDTQLTDMFLEKKGVLLVPGSAFGCEGCIRISYATSDEALEEALDRMEVALS